MRSTILPVILSALPFAFAQNSTGAAAPTTTPSAGSKLHTVAVGNGLIYTPNSITAAVGDTVEFLFYPRGHDVVQGAFDTPCNPLAGGAGFSSGVFNSTGLNQTSFTITVRDSNPIWYYCSVPGHCQGGMVGVINPPTTGANTIAAFRSASQNVTNPARAPSVQGGVLGPVKSTTNSTSAGTSSGSASGTASGTAAGTRASGTPTTPAASGSSSAAPNAGVEARGGVQWMFVGAASLVAAAFGSLIL